MDIKLETTWKTKLISEIAKPYFSNLVEFIKSEYKTKQIFPSGKNIFRAFDLTPFDQVKVVILGQDPYHTPGVANGLAFSVNSEQKIPPSLQNIYKEIEDDIGYKPLEDGDLSRWAEQGVLLLNSTLTVEKCKPASHQGKGWEEFTDSIIKILNKEKENLVFILWGKFAISKGEKIDKSKHLVLAAAHPSPFSAHKGFFGCKHFSKTNQYLSSKSLDPIIW